MATKKQVVWTIKLVTDAPIDPAEIIGKLDPLGRAEVVTFSVKTVK